MASAPASSYSPATRNGCRKFAAVRAISPAATCDSILGWELHQTSTGWRSIGPAASKSPSARHLWTASTHLPRGQGRRCRISPAPDTVEGNGCEGDDDGEALKRITRLRSL